MFRQSGEEQGHTLEENIQENTTVINLLKKTISATKINILAKELEFILTPQRSNQNEIKDDILEFFRNL